MKRLQTYIIESFDSFLEMSEDDKQYLLELDREYAELVWLHRNDYNFKDILNKPEERDKFFKAYDKGEVYNPIIKLGKCNYVNDHILERLELLNNKFKAFTQCYLSKFYIENISKLIKDVESRIAKLEKQEDMVCAPVNKDLYDLAVQIIKKHKYKSTTKNNNRNIDAEHAVKQMQDALDELGYDFSAKIYSNMLPRMNVLPEKILRVHDTAKFSTEDIEGLVAHEIKGHVGRRFYGYQTGLYLFVHGLDGRNMTDEGMAVWNSLNIVKKQKPNILFNIALKYIIYSIAIKNDFYNTFKIVTKLLEDTGNKELHPKILYNTILRCKRCCIDTQYKGGNISDTDYFAGYEYVKKLSDKDREDLLKYNVGPKQVYEIATIKKFLNINKFEPIKDIEVFIPELQ